MYTLQIELPNDTYNYLTTFGGAALISYAKNIIVEP